MHYKHGCPWSSGAFLADAGLREWPAGRERPDAIILYGHLLQLNIFLLYRDNHYLAYFLESMIMPCQLECHFMHFYSCFHDWFRHILHLILMLSR